MKLLAAILVVALANPIIAVVLPQEIPLGTKIINSDAAPAFRESELIWPQNMLSSREIEPDPDRPAVTPEYLFVVQCLDAGFRKPCLVFGSKPGHCVSYFDYDTKANISGTYQNSVSSLSTNTGGVCQFFAHIKCNNKGDDPGVTLDYQYNLNLSANGYSGDYENRITSWLC